MCIRYNLSSKEKHESERLEGNRQNTVMGELKVTPGKAGPFAVRVHRALSAQ